MLMFGSLRSKVRIQVAHNRRYTPEFVQVKALLAGGFAGDTIHALFGFANGLTAHWSSVNPRHRIRSTTGLQRD